MTKTKKNKNKYILLTILIIVVFIFFIVFINAKPNEPVVDKIETPKDINQVLPTLMPDLVNDVQTLKQNSLILLKDANAFYDEYKDFSTYISKNGLLYNYNTKQYIEPKSIYTESEMSNEKARILFLKKDDVNTLIKNNNNNNNFVVCISYEIADGYIFSAFDKEITITKSQYIDILKKYMNSSIVSGISVLKESTDGQKTIKLIVDAINKEENTKNHFDIRYLSKDDKYALAILSPVDKPAEIKEYILQQINNNWTVILKDIENQIKPAQYINTNILDFNLDFLPSYNICEYKTLISDDADSLFEALKTEQYVDTKDAIDYFSLVDDFAYFKFKSGKNFLCNLSTSRNWVVYDVKGYEEAVLMMLSIDKDAPIFVLNQHRE